MIPSSERVLDRPLGGGGTRGTIRVICPKCNRRSRQHVKVTREGAAGSIRRTRKCLECLSSFTTYERIEEKRPMVWGEVVELLREAHSKLSRAIERA